MIITGEDEAKNTAKAQIVKLAKEKFEQAKLAIEDQLAEAVFNAGGTSNQPQGLRLAGNITGTCGAIDKSSSSFWQGNLDSSSTTLTLPLINNAISDTEKLNGRTTVIYTTHSILDRMCNLLQPQQRFEDPKSADAGFRSILIKGVPVIADSHVPTNYLFGIDESTMKFYVHKNRNMHVGNFIEPVNQDVKVAKVLTMCALVYGSCRTIFTFSALAA